MSWIVLVPYDSQLRGNEQSLEQPHRASVSLDWSVSDRNMTAQGGQSQVSKVMWMRLSYIVPIQGKAVTYTLSPKLEQGSRR